MATTGNFQLDLLTDAQSLKSATINKNSEIIDTGLQSIVINMTTTAPPGSPTEGDAYIVAATATGDWVGLEDSLVRWTNDAWHEIPPFDGYKVFDLGTLRGYLYSTADTWQPFIGKKVKKIDFPGTRGVADTGASYSVGSYTNFSIGIWTFAINVDEGVSYHLVLPKHSNYENCNIRLHWTVASNSTGDCVWKYTIYEADSGDDLTTDPSTVTASTTFTGPLNSDILEQTTFGSFDLSNTTDSDTLLVLNIEHNGTAGADSIDQAVELLMVELEVEEKSVLDAGWV